MLVLARHLNERIRIGGSIELTVVEIRGDVIKLGINAPRHLRIDRVDASGAVQFNREDAKDAKAKPQG